MLRELRSLVIWLLVAGLLGAGVVLGGRPALRATGVWVDGGSPTIDPGLYAPPATPSPTPVAPAPYAAPRSPVAPPAGAALLGRLQAVPRTGLGRVSMTVTDPATGSVVTTEAGDSPLVPASSLKLLTSAAALAAYGPDHRFTTKVVTGAGDQVVLVGGGDPMLRGATPDRYPLRASIVDLAEGTAAALKARGTTTVSLGYDESLFTGPGWNPVWPQAYAEFSTPTSALWVDQGIVAGIHRPTPTADAVAVFVAQLQARGIKVTATSPVVAAKDATQLAAVQSLPLELIVQELLLRSDNDASEVLFRHVAIAAGRPGSIAEAQQAMPARLAEIGLWRDGMRTDDGSGLSRGNLATSTSLAAAVTKGFTDPRYRSLIGGLPTAAADGTLSARYDDPATEGAGRGVVRAKTGTLTGIHTLAGFATTRNGQTLAFSFMTNDVVPNGDLVARDWLERVSAAVAACGC